MEPHGLGVEALKPRWTLAKHVALPPQKEERGADTLVIRERERVSSSTCRERERGSRNVSWRAPLLALLTLLACGLSPLLYGLGPIGLCGLSGYLRHVFHGLGPFSIMSTLST